MNRHGLFKLLWDAPSKAIDAFPLDEFEALEGCRALLSPSEIARETLGARRDFADAGDDETAAMLAQCLLFHENYYRDNFFVFRSTDGDAYQGEYSVHAFESDDAFEWQPERIDFARHLQIWVDAVLEDD